MCAIFLGGEGGSQFCLFMIGPTNGYWSYPSTIIFYDQINWKPDSFFRKSSHLHHLKIKWVFPEYCRAAGYLQYNDHLEIKMAVHKVKDVFGGLPSKYKKMIQWRSLFVIIYAGRVLCMCSLYHYMWVDTALSRSVLDVGLLFRAARLTSSH